MNEFLTEFPLYSCGGGQYVVYRANPPQFLRNNWEEMDSVKFIRSKYFTSVKLKILDISFLAFLEQKLCCTLTIWFKWCSVCVLLFLVQVPGEGGRKT